MAAQEKIFPSPDILNDQEYGKFVLANLAAKRAKQLKEGAPPLVRIDSNHPLSIALAEIAAGKIKPILGSDAHATVEMDDELVALDKLDLGEIGLLLPAIDEDESEVLAKAGGVFGDDDDEHEHEHDEDETDDAGATSLVDLLDEDEAEPEAVEEDGDLSLDDLAEQEEAGQGDEEKED
ncbi:MAG: DNA-directed RNA polymerase subunit omega [Fimbriimonadaceae bacterium]|nr:DNA-directed RNA polymerase subunit omega [Fimbriimonadaceae bacterium]